MATEPKNISNTRPIQQPLKKSLYNAKYRGYIAKVSESGRWYLMYIFDVDDMVNSFPRNLSWFPRWVKKDGTYFSTHTNICRILAHISNDIFMKNITPEKLESEKVLQSNMKFVCSFDCSLDIDINPWKSTENDIISVGTPQAIEPPMWAKVERNMVGDDIDMSMETPSAKQQPNDDIDMDMAIPSAGTYAQQSLDALTKMSKKVVYVPLTQEEKDNLPF